MRDFTAEIMDSARTQYKAI